MVCTICMCHSLLNSLDLFYGEMCTVCRSCLKLAEENGLKILAFPSMSCGVHGFPPHHAAKVHMH